MEYDFKNIKRNETPELCKECGGACCKRQPCTCFPHDVFGDKVPTAQRLIDFLASDNYQIDWWEGDPFDPEFYEDGYKYSRIYYIRPRENPNPEIAHSNMLYDPMWFGECYLHTSTGCALDWDHRPSGGKSLTCIAPNVASDDTPEAKKAAAKEWRELQWLFEGIENREFKN